MFPTYQSAASALALFCSRRGIRVAHHVGGFDHRGPSDPRVFVEVCKEIVRLRPTDPVTGIAQRHDETTESLIAYGIELEKEIAEADAVAAPAREKGGELR